MIEAMATGTPVIATRSGSVPELIADGVTGFVCDSSAEMVRAVERVREIDRAKCRQHVEDNFSPAAMASAYETVYRSVVAAKPGVPADDRTPLTPVGSPRRDRPFGEPR